MKGKDQASRTCAELLVDTLIAHGTDRVFCVPGESYLAVLDALHQRRGVVDTITCRQEGGAAMMAEADGKLTGRPGICMVTRGPGATNAAAGLHVAAQDSTPFILFVGQVGQEFMDREAFQEVDYRRVFGSMAKWVAQVEAPERIAEYVTRAFAVAMSGRPGPVVLVLPENILPARVEGPSRRLFPGFEIYPGAEQMQTLRRMLAAAHAPLLVAGGARWDETAWSQLRTFAEANDLPVAAAWRRQDRFDNAHHCYVGNIGWGMNPRLRQRVVDSDLLIVLGSRLGEATTDDYGLIRTGGEQRLVHIHAGAGELGLVYQPELAINATPRGFASMLAAMEPVAGPWAEWRRTARADFEEWQRPAPGTGEIDVGEVVAWLRDSLPEDAVLTNGAGNFTAWIHRYHGFRRLGTQLAPTSGSMGYGYPAAVAAKLRHPDRTVVCLAGDGDFLMTAQEMATAARYEAAVIVVVLDNGMYGTIRMHQERHYPEREHATALRNPDFAAFAGSFGGYVERVERTANFAPAFRRAVASGRPALLHLKIDPEAITPTETLSGIRAKALASATGGS